MSDPRTPTVASDPVPPRLPTHFRVRSLERLLNPNGTLLNRAVLFHERASLSVSWTTQQVDTRLHKHGLVTVRYAGSTQSEEGAVRIERLLPADRPDASLNLFETLPSEWIKDRDLVVRAIRLWQQLPRPLAHLVNAVLWESTRCHRFILGPSSLRDHHADWHGNFRHSVEVAENALATAERIPEANRPLLIAAGLLHDVGKAEEYRYDRDTRRFSLSLRGELIGHRGTLCEWLGIAREGVLINDELFMALLHAVTAAQGAPDYLGLREPRCLEAHIISMADRLSGLAQVHGAHAPPEGQPGLGRRAPGQRGRAYRPPALPLEPMTSSTERSLRLA